MDFILSSEQQMLRDGARRFVTTKLDYAARAERIATSDDNWKDFAEMGWLMLPVPQEAGGLGGALEDMVIVAEELGRGLALEPFVAGAVLPARLLTLSSNPRAGDLLGQLAAGDRRFAAALFEARRRYSLDGLASVAARQSDGGYLLTGDKHLVGGGAQADVLIVAARLGDDRAPALFVVDTAATGVTRRSYHSIDGVAVADIAFEGVRLEADALLAEPQAAAAALDQALDEATVLLCADAIGCADRAIEMTAAYLRVRAQFGQPLASFQALQHGVARLFIETYDARSIMYRAVAACAGDDAGARARAVSACKVKVLEAAHLATGQAVHYHGGIGMTCEYPVGEHLRRTLVAEQTFGNSQHHMERYLGSRSL